LRQSDIFFAQVQLNNTTMKVTIHLPRSLTCAPTYRKTS